MLIEINRDYNLFLFIMHKFSLTEQPTEDYIEGQEALTYSLNDIESLLCFSHLRWDFVFQRPQHLMSRAAKNWRVFFVEEPVFSDEIRKPELIVRQQENPDTLFIVVPHFPQGFNPADVNKVLQDMLARLTFDFRIEDFGLWYYTPMALKFTANLMPRVVVYDAMDELSAFKGASSDLIDMEKILFSSADVVFTGGRSLYEAKRQRHPNVYAFPSSIDKKHFMQARQLLPEPEEQKNIPHPRLGFYGVVDERFDIELLRELANRRPEWHFVIIGPVVKISPEELPRAENIHYLGMKSYNELPVYLSGWDVALLLFALNESTRFISPTKTPEYLAALKPVVSTPIQDVIVPYEEAGLVSIGRNVEEFENAIEYALNQADNEGWKTKVDSYLQNISWDKTWDGMTCLIKQQIADS